VLIFSSHKLFLKAYSGSIEEKMLCFSSAAKVICIAQIHTKNNAFVKTLVNIYSFALIFKKKKKKNASKSQL
jgi:hypothetical protein